MNVLVIEDDNLLRRTLGHYLLDIGHMVSTCTNGQEAMDFIKTHPEIDCVIVDIFMPVLSGPAFILLLQKQFQHNMPHVVVISAAKDGRNFLTKLDVPFDAYIQKPIDFEDLGQLLQSWEKKQAG